jgi:hypothetical protein
VRIRVFYMTSYSKFGIFEIFRIKILKNSLKMATYKLWLHTSQRAALGIILCVFEFSI